VDLAKIVFLSVVLGAVVGAVSAVALSGMLSPSKEALMRDFYFAENAVHVSPHSLRKSMDSGALDVTLVDLRSQEEYEREHIIGAINIPAYKDKDTSDYGAVERIVGAFGKLPKDKDVVVYCYSIPCMTGRKVGKILAERGIYVKLLGVGWNEWRYYWELWNHEHEWNATDVEDYIASGPEPGVPKNKAGTPQGVCAKGQFGC